MKTKAQQNSEKTNGKIFIRFINELMNYKNVHFINYLKLDGTVDEEIEIECKNGDTLYFEIERDYQYTTENYYIEGYYDGKVTIPTHLSINNINFVQLSTSDDDIEIQFTEQEKEVIINFLEKAIKNKLNIVEGYMNAYERELSRADDLHEESKIN